MPTRSVQENLYTQGINTVIGYVRENLHEDLSLDTLARVAGFSPFHFYWLPHSRYQPTNLPGMEIYRRQPIELGWKTFDIDCAIPIVAL